MKITKLRDGLGHSFKQKQNDVSVILMETLVYV